jgi:hypothetical protein
LLEIVRCGTAALMPPASWLGMYSSTFVPLAIHKPFEVEPVEPPDEDDEPPDEDDEDDEPLEEDDEPPDEDDEPPDEDDEDDEPPEEDDDDVDAAIDRGEALLPPPQPASSPLMTTATDMILSSSPRLKLLMENRFMASPV